MLSKSEEQEDVKIKFLLYQDPWKYNGNYLSIIVCTYRATLGVQVEKQFPALVDGCIKFYWSYQIALHTKIRLNFKAYKLHSLKKIYCYPMI